MRTLIAVVAVALSAITAAPAQEAWCAANPTNCVCSDTFTSTSYTKNTSVSDEFSAVFLGDQVGSKPCHYLADASMQVVYNANTFATTLAVSTDATILGKLPQRDASAVPRFLRHGANLFDDTGTNGQDSTYRFGYDPIALGSAKRLSMRWYVYHSADYETAYYGSCTNGKIGHVSAASYNTPRLTFTWLGGTSSTYSWQDDWGWAWPSGTAGFDGWSSGNPPRPGAYAQLNNLRDRWLRFELIIKHPRAADASTAGVGFGYELWITDVTNGGAPVLDQQLSAGCTGCTGVGNGVFPPNSFTYQDADLQALHTEYYRSTDSASNGTCTGSGTPWGCCTGRGTGTCNVHQCLGWQGWLYLAIAKWDTDAGQMIGAATEVEGGGTPDTPANSRGIWIAQSTLAALPTSGQGWTSVLAAANTTAGAPDITDIDSAVDVLYLAKALVYARDTTTYASKRTDVVGAIEALVAADMKPWWGENANCTANVTPWPCCTGNTTGTCHGSAETLAICRGLQSYVIAADLVGLSAADETTFKAWLVAGRVHDVANATGTNIVQSSEERPNNQGSHCRAARLAIARYLGAEEVATGVTGDQDVVRIVTIFKGWLGDRAQYNEGSAPGFDYGDLSWQATQAAPVGINPVGAVISTHDVNGVQPDDQRRQTGIYSWPPLTTTYTWGNLAPSLTVATMLDRAGYTGVWGWSDSALKRAVAWLYRTTFGDGAAADNYKYPASGNDEWQPWLINHFYGTSYGCDSTNLTCAAARAGKAIGWTEWTHASVGSTSIIQGGVTLRGATTRGVSVGRSTACGGTRSPLVFSETFDSGTPLDSGKWPGWAQKTVNGSQAFVSSSPAPKAGAYAFGFSVTDDTSSPYEERSELLRYSTSVLGSTSRYKWSFYVPAAYSNTGSFFQVIGQWHGDDGIASPMVSLQIQQTTPTTNVSFALEMRKAGSPLVVEAFTDIAKGQWHDVVVDLKWAQDATGYVDVCLDGAPLTAFNGSDHRDYGQTLPAASSNPALFSFGLYRDAVGLSAADTVYGDELSIYESNTTP